jgi:hypothetical protein
MAAWEFQTLQNIADKHGWHKFISMQNYYNLIYREEGELHSLTDPALFSFCPPLRRIPSPFQVSSFKEQF